LLSARRAETPAGQPIRRRRYYLLLTKRVTSITSVPLLWHRCALFDCERVAIVPIEVDVGISPTESLRSIPIGGCLCERCICSMRPLALRWHAGFSSGKRWSTQLHGSGLRDFCRTVFPGLGVRPVAQPFRQRAPIASFLIPEVIVTKVCRYRAGFFALSIQ